MKKGYTQNKMASLTEIAQSSKKIVRGGIIISLSLLILKLAFTVGKSIWQKFYPPAPPPPTVSFNKLPPPQFPQKEELVNGEFILETPTGSLPSLGEQAKVYLSPYQRPNLLALEKAKEEVASLGFTNEPQALSSEIYRWSKVSPLNAVLEMNIFSGAFTFSYDWQTDKTLLSSKTLPQKEQAIDEAENFLKKLGRLADDLENGKMETTYLRLTAAKLIPAASLSEADFVKVEIFRKEIENMPVLTADPEKGIVTIMLSGASTFDKRIIEAEFNYFPVDYQSSATYPIKSSLQAWEELKEGKAFVASLTDSPQKITIRRIYLAYFDSWKPQKYLQPIFVFQGDNDFFAYLPAVTDEWLEQLPIGD